MLAALGGIGWWGLQVNPAPLSPPADDAVDRGTVPTAADLPAPVARFIQAGLGGRVPAIDAAVITGRGRLTLAGVTLPSRFRFTERGGRDYHHFIECTWFGYPILKVNEWYLDGHLRQELPFGTVANDPKLDTAANLALWGEAVWLPSILLGDPRLRWEAIDGASARLVVPAGQGEDQLTVTFDRETGRMRSMTALRYRSANDAAKTPWRVGLLDWADFHGVRAPSRVSLTWLDQGKPWLMLTVEDVAYNVDVASRLRSPGR